MLNVIPPAAAIAARKPRRFTPGATPFFRRAGRGPTIDAAFEAEYDIERRIPGSKQHFAQYQLDSAAARAAMTCELDLVYGPGDGERLDFFPASRRDAPLFLFIHGGYWRAFDKRDFSFIAPPFVGEGIAVALVNYDPAPDVPIEDIHQQVQRAIRWAHGNARSLGFNPDRLVVGGHSAGAQLAAAALGCEPPLPIAAGITLSGVFDLLPLLRTSINAELGLDEARARRLSPVHDPRPAIAPALIAAGGAETRSFIWQSQAFARHCGLAARIYPGLNHYTILSALARPGSEVHKDVQRVIRYASG